MSGIFIAANLALGFTFSTIATTQLQATQTAVFFLLPSILLSGFAFPFRGMPHWAQWLGELLPATHFLRVVRGILLKSNYFSEIWPNVWPLLLFLFVIGSVALLRYRRIPRLADFNVTSAAWLFQARGLLGRGAKRIFRALIGGETFPKEEAF